MDFYWRIIQLANSDNSLMQERATNRLILSCRIGPVLNVTNLCCFLLCQRNSIGWRFWHHAVISLWWGISLCPFLNNLGGEKNVCYLREALPEAITQSLGHESIME